MGHCQRPREEGCNLCPYQEECKEQVATFHDFIVEELLKKVEVC